jgi:hypothetical protein
VKSDDFRLAHDHAEKAVHDIIIPAVVNISDHDDIGIVFGCIKLSEIGLSVIVHAEKTDRTAGFAKMKDSRARSADYFIFLNRQAKSLQFLVQSRRRFGGGISGKPAGEPVRFDMFN